MQIWTLFFSWNWKWGGNIFTIFSSAGEKKFFGRILLTYSRLLPNGFVVTETKWPCRMSFPINIMILHARFRHQHFSGLNSFKRETDLNFVSKFFLERTFSAIFCKVSTSIVQSTSMLPWWRWPFSWWLSWWTWWWPRSCSRDQRDFPWGCFALKPILKLPYDRSQVYTYFCMYIWI